MAGSRLTAQPQILQPSSFLLAFRKKYMEDISSDSCEILFVLNSQGLQRISELKEDRKTTPRPGFRVQEKPQREFREWLSDCKV